MRNLLNTYLSITELLNDNNIDIITTYDSKSRYGTMLVDRNTGQTLFLPIQARHHMQKIEKKPAIPTVEKNDDRSSVS
jgi:hypothetical protein